MEEAILEEAEFYNVAGVGSTSLENKLLHSNEKSVRLHSKSHQKVQNLLTGWHLEVLGGYQ